jgi:hypothetical protein
MELLKNFSTDSFCRTIWVSAKAREAWEKTIRDFSQASQELEVLSVVHGQRPVAWQTVREDNLAELSMKWASQGLVSLPIRRVGNFTGFAHRHVPVKPGEVALMCVILARNLGDARAFMEANQKNDNVTQGVLLGFPRCCSQFFEDVWKDGYYDPIWQMLGPNVRPGERKIRVDIVHPFSNPILRYNGIRIGFHIPHSFTCADTIKINQERFDLGKTLWPGLMERGLELLSMPMSWDVLHGIAVVRHPLFYIVTSSVPARERHVIELAGNHMPEEAVRGTTYPYTLTADFLKNIQTDDTR